MVSKNNRTGVRARAQGLVIASVAAATLSGCGGGSNTAASVPPPTVQPLSAAAVAGEALFHDTSLSASGKQSCATCHVKSRAFTGDPVVDNGLPVPLGGRNMDLPGFRNAPSLMYAVFRALRSRCRSSSPHTVRMC
jgi:cytochrome c peroxidase